MKDLDKTTSSHSRGGRSNKQQSSSSEDHVQCGSFSGERRTLTLRLVFLLSMVIAGIVFGIIAYSVTKHLEEDVAYQTFESVAASALEEAKAISQRKVKGAQTMSTIVGFAFPDASQWPLVGLRGYTEIAEQVGDLSSTTGIGFMVIVTPEQAAEFEQHSQELYRQYGYPETAGWSDFGFGIYDTNPAISTYEDQRYHDVSGNTTGWTSQYSLMIPFLQHKNAIKNPNLLQMNVHAKELRGTVMDSVIACGKRAEEAGEAFPKCSVVTKFTEIFVRPGPSAVIFLPIFPADAPSKVVGLHGASVHWEEVLTNVFPDFVDGLHCVISMPSTGQSYTYGIERGVPLLLGEGDLHDQAYESYAHSVFLFDENETGAEASASYRLTIYPTVVMVENRRTSNPIYVSIGFVGLIVVCTGLFFLYDYFMKSESHQRKKILELKRRFVRFISHEIRTPLNVVCMGLELLQTEMRDQIDVDAARNKQDQDPPPPLFQVTTTPAIGLSAPSSGNSSSSNGGAGALFASLPPPPETEQDPKKPPPPAEGPIVKSNSRSSLRPAGASTSSLRSLGASQQERAAHSYWLGLTGDILESAQIAVSVLNDLLNYDKIESGTFQLEVEPVNFLRLVKKTVSEFSIQARNRSVELELSVETGVAELFGEVEDLGGPHRSPDGGKHQVMGDEVRLAQVVRNLISNALKFAPEVDGKVTVAVDFSQRDMQTTYVIDPSNASSVHSKSSGAFELHEGPLVVVTVQDNGVGLTPEQLGKLFGEGVQFDANKLQSGGGSGLGLFITKEIIDKHGGQILARSDGCGSGAAFEIQLPLVEADEDEEHGNLSYSEATETVATNASLEPFVNLPRHILVVDDVISNTKMLSRLLERAGHSCSVAHDGEEAIAAFEENRHSAGEIPLFDTILMDFEMPKLNGPAATKELRERGCKAAIFGVTGNVLAEDMAFFRSNGADDVIPKPVNLAAIEACWAGYHHHRQQHKSTKVQKISV